MSGKKLVRKKGKIFGVCTGLGEYFEVDPTIFRVLFVLAAFIWIGVLVYWIFAVVVPMDDDLDSLPLMVKNEFLRMSTGHQQEFAQEYNRRKKSLPTAYLLLLWIFALHYAYVGRWGMQILFWITLGGFFMWWIIDIVRLPRIVRDHNMGVATDVMKSLKLISNPHTF